MDKSEMGGIPLVFGSLLIFIFRANLSVIVFLESIDGVNIRLILGYKQMENINIQKQINTGIAIAQYFEGTYVKPILFNTKVGINAQNIYNTSNVYDAKYNTNP